MIVSHKHKLIFIKTRKTASTSIEFALAQLCGPDDIIVSLGDDTEKNRKELGYRKPQNSFVSFSSYSIRDWAKFALSGKRKSIAGQHSSAEYIKKMVGGDVFGRYFKFCFERNPYDRAISLYYWRTRAFTEKPDINQYVQQLTSKDLSNWVLYTINGNVVVDYVGQYHSLHADIAHLSEVLKVAIADLPRTKTNTRKNYLHYSQVLNKRTRVHIENICSEEIEKFRYHWIDAV